MDKPTKPTDLMPRTFGGLKENYSTSLQQTGVEPNVPVIYHGKNFNYEKNAIGQELDYCEKIADFINALPIGKGITVDANNKLVYADYGTDITGKANISLDNLNADGKARIAIKEYLVTETYIQGDVVLAIIDDEVSLFKSLVDNNTGNALTDNTKWEEVQLGGATRNIGEIVASTIPLTDAGLHLLDGSLIDGSGIYSAFVDYIAGLYTDNPTANYFAQATGYVNITSGGTAISSGDYSGFPVSNAFDGNTSTVWGSSQMGTNVAGNAYIGCSGLTAPIKKVRMYQGYPSLTSNYCTDFKFQYSNDGTTWIDIDTVTNGANLTWQEWILPDFTPSGSTYSFRVLATGGFTGGASNNWTVGELQLYRGATPEESWEEEVTTYGVCGKFVYNSVNNTVRLPKYSNKIYTQELDATAPVIGNGIGLGLTNGSQLASLVGLSNGNILTTVNGNIGDDVGTSYASGSGTNINNTVLGVTNDPDKSGLIAQLSDITTSLDGYYYIVIANSTKTDIQVDIDEIATDLNDKVDKSDLAEVQCVVETYINGTSWYRVYSDGWCEQGGYTTADDSNISLLLAFSNTNYNLQFTCINNSSSDTYAWCRSKTTTTFYLSRADAATGTFWQASGYIEV